MRLSGLTCAAFFLAGILGGGSVALLFLGRRASERQAARTPPLPILAPAATPVEENASSPPHIVIGTGDVRPKQTPDALEAGGKQVYCFFDIPEAPPSATPTARWLRGPDPPVEAEGSLVREDGEHLRGYLALRPPQGAKAFAEGIYEIELLVDGVPVTDTSFAVLKGVAELAETPKGMERYRPAIAELTVSGGQAPRSARKPFVLPAGPTRVQADFKYSHAVPGMAFTVYWLHQDGLIAQATTEINIQHESGKAEAWLSPAPGQTLPNGRYGVEVSIGEGTPPLARADFWIGRQPRPAELQPRR